MCLCCIWKQRSSGFRAWEAQKPAELSDVSATERCASRKQLPAGFPWPGLEVLKHSCSQIHGHGWAAALQSVFSPQGVLWGGFPMGSFQVMVVELGDTSLSCSPGLFLHGQKQAQAASHGCKAGTGHRQSAISTWAKAPRVHTGPKHVTLSHPHTISAHVTTHAETHTRSSSRIQRGCEF